MRQFKSGATRDSEDNKIDLEGFLSPIVLQAFGEYMNRHRNTANGVRESDNWQKLFGDDHYDVCMKSLWRHFHDLWMEHRGYKSRDGIENAINGCLFNLQAYYFKYLNEKRNKKM
jgi:hypothetical protein